MRAHKVLHAVILWMAILLGFNQSVWMSSSYPAPPWQMHQREVSPKACGLYHANDSSRCAVVSQ
eukprot:1127337-Heterocapsa_arctica.AAC.1